MLKAIDNLGFERASPIQSRAIPLILRGIDVVGQSQTGSGKTAAFAIPAVEKIDPSVRAVQILILLPTRELAMQVADEIHKLTLFKPHIRSVPIYGGASYDRQFQALRQGAQMVIGTPGRVMDHMRRGTLNLKSVRMVVLDEADRMLDMGFREDIELILKSAPAERQTVFFSATLPRPIQELIREFGKTPQSVRIDEHKAATVPTVEQIFYEVQRYGKIEALTRIIDLRDIRLAIIFCNTKRMVDELTDDLQARGFLADRLHGDISQAARSRVMEKFRKSAFDLLVATDVAARGIDVEHVEAVFNYDLPHDSEDYVHRIGRTGRAGRKGLAVTFVQGRDLHFLNRIERFTKTRIRREAVPSIDAVEEKRFGNFFDRLREVLEKTKFKRHDAMIDQLLEQGYSSTDIASALIHLLFESQSLSRQTPPQLRSPASVSRAPKSTRTSTTTHLMYARSKHQEIPSSPQNSVAVKDFHTKHGILGEKSRRVLDQDRSQSVDEKGMRRLKLNVGKRLAITPRDLVDKIMVLTRLPPHAIGAITIFPDHAFVDIVQKHASIVMNKLERIKMRGRKLRVDWVTDARSKFDAMNRRDQKFDTRR